MQPKSRTMALKCGIIGITGSGKTTLFNSVSRHRADRDGTLKANLGTVMVPDPRLEAIDRYVGAAKVTPTTMEMVDIPGLARGGTGMGSRFLAEIRNVDALIHVIRCYDDPHIPHPDGSVNPVRDCETVELELQIRDLESVEKKLQRLEKAAKSGDKEAIKGLEVLNKVKDHLESFQPIRTLDLPREEMVFIQDLFLLSQKPVLYVCNVDDTSAATGNQYSSAFMEQMLAEGAETIVLGAQLESDIAELEDQADRLAFLEDAGLTEPGVNKLIRAAYHLLDLQTFFTAGPKEVRAWTIRRGMTAPQAAGVIHSDLERGFIRTEVIRYEDFIALKSEHACKEAGKLMIEGKSYIVQDGDMLHIRFNV